MLAFLGELKRVSLQKYCVGGESVVPISKSANICDGRTKTNRSAETVSFSLVKQVLNPAILAISNKIYFTYREEIVGAVEQVLLSTQSNAPAAFARVKILI
jgi:hypothetical protein